MYDIQQADRRQAEEPADQHTAAQDVSRATPQASLAVTSPGWRKVVMYPSSGSAHDGDAEESGMCCGVASAMIRITRSTSS